ncbi:alginate export family protein [Pseudoteredinibacter isoporae]|uniref:alginate export family protein n=1 Tax=Pseudoteredinibacter isoporae TaxID=570281 RepID=UPI003102102F
MKILDNLRWPMTLMTVISLLASKAYAHNVLEAKVDLRLRYEHVDQDNDLLDADALTLRTRLNVTTKTMEGFSVLIDIEDSRQLLGLNEYNNTLGENTRYSVIADPETTEVDQALVQYKSKSLVAKVGRQVLAYDSHRFVGHVGFRQDRQTFDAVSVSYTGIQNLAVNYAYIGKRNRIFSNEKDINSQDQLFNVAYNSSVGTLSAYAYLLEVDSDFPNSLDSYGMRFTGKRKIDSWSILYSAEFAHQNNKNGSQSFDADYALLELGATVSGLTAKLGYELLGSDQGRYGFSTPLATLHKFNGWTDPFLRTPNQGLEDRFLSLSGMAGDGKWLIACHDFSADDVSDSNGSRSVDDLGREIGFQFVMPFAKRYSLGVKYANYSAGDSGSNKVDAEKLWIWLGAKF